MFPCHTVVQPPRRSTENRTSSRLRGVLTGAALALLPSVAFASPGAVEPPAIATTAPDAPAQLPVGISDVIGVGVEDPTQANVSAATSAVDAETAGYKSCTSGNDSYAQVDVFSHPADAPQGGQPYGRGYEMHAWLGTCTFHYQSKDGAWLSYHYYYGSDSRYCGGCNYYQVDNISIYDRAWDCGSLYYQLNPYKSPGYVVGDQTPETSAGNNCGPQADLQANWQSWSNWNANAYINESGNSTCSPCINLSMSQAQMTGLAAIGRAGSRSGAGGFSATQVSHLPSLATLNDLAGYRVFASTLPLDAWIVLATAPAQHGMTDITGWAVVNARSGAVVAAGENNRVARHAVSRPADCQGAAIRTR